MRLTLFTLLLLVAACDNEPPDTTQTAVVSEADVERFRAEIFQETLTLDADLARLETEAAASDSVAQVAYAPVLDRLRSDRRRLQVGLDSLRPAQSAVFDTTRAEIRARTQRLGASIRRARYDAAPTYETFRSAVARGLGDLDAQLATLRAAGQTDTTGRLVRAVDSVAADRERLSARVGAYPDTLASQFVPFRSRMTDGVVALERRAAEIAADTARAEVAADTTVAE